MGLAMGIWRDGACDGDMAGWGLRWGYGGMGLAMGIWRDGACDGDMAGWGLRWGYGGTGLRLECGRGWAYGESGKGWRCGEDGGGVNRWGTYSEDVGDAYGANWN